MKSPRVSAPADDAHSVRRPFQIPICLATLIQLRLYVSLEGDDVPFLSYHQPLFDDPAAMSMEPARAHCEAKLAQSAPAKRTYVVL